MTEIHQKVVAIYGSSLLSNDQLITALNKEFQVVPCQKVEKLMSNLDKLNVSVLLMEIDEKDVELKLLNKVKARHRNIPIIALGEGRQQELIAKAFQLGIQDFFKAPYKVDLLLEKIRSLL